jgi:hypothetical protein
MDGKLYGFKTEILKIQFEPTPLLFLKYPRDVENLKLRKDDRIPVNIPVRIAYEQKGFKPFTGDGIILDVSPSGCRISAQGNYTQGFQISLSFTLPGVERIEGMKGVIKNARLVGHQSLIGVEFDSDREELLNNLLNEFFNIAKTFRKIPGL